ncbi:MAG TPA: hypothetical protein VL026_09085 [Rhizomicrobium sp.]|nr:hypothetical protein [Rhizomicrobium sp.]
MITTSDDLEKNAEGKIITCPVKGFTSAAIADMSVFLQVRYAQTPEQLKAAGKVIQFAMTPQQALTLAEMMTKQARHILDQTPSTPPH